MVIALFYRNNTIEIWIGKIITKFHMPPIMTQITYVLLAAAIVVIEEILVAYEIYKRTEKLKTYANILKEKNDDGTPKSFGNLCDKEKLALNEFYESVEDEHTSRMRLMARESATQLTYQTALILYQFVFPPLRELNYSND